mmetsp:Transcript_7629/g.17094  ORF Transcript_7629/g.17094 Transcript_7629/m.17094 type:complete len:209 (-) Transcript_7629:254-880(-)
MESQLEVEEVPPKQFIDGSRRLCSHAHVRLLKVRKVPVGVHAVLLSSMSRKAIHIGHRGDPSTATIYQTPDVLVVVPPTFTQETSKFGHHQGSNLFISMKGTREIDLRCGLSQQCTIGDSHDQGLASGCTTLGPRRVRTLRQNFWENLLSNIGVDDLWAFLLQGFKIQPSRLIAVIAIGPVLSREWSCQCGLGAKSEHHDQQHHDSDP